MPGFPMVAHVLLIEAPGALALVDTGFGLSDIAHPRSRVGFMRLLLHPALDPEETAVRQLTHLGFEPGDVRHIILTHLDLDHVGGLADFPHAQVHVMADELRSAIGSPTAFERLRYQPAQFSHHPNWVRHSPGPESWRGFKGAVELTAVSPGIILIPLPGHSPGHMGVAIDTGHGWIFHTGDAFYDHGAVRRAVRPPVLVDAMERIVANDRGLVQQNHRRLAELATSDPGLGVISAHDPADLARFLP